MDAWRSTSFLLPGVLLLAANARADEPPSTLPYRAGEPAPKGYHLEAKPNGRLIQIGGSMFATAYLLAVALSFVPEEGDPGQSSHSLVKDSNDLLIPVAGPLLAVNAQDDFDRNSGGALVFDAVVQAAGVTLIAAGLLDRKKIWVRGPESALLVAPRLSPTSIGLCAAVTWDVAP